ncbi:hypothetical protein DA102_026530 [Sinorhizobium meliloti]|nr:hypothetical protein DA102_026530 [Sinorhizobium meliloti]
MTPVCRCLDEARGAQRTGRWAFVVAGPVQRSDKVALRAESHSWIPLNRKNFPKVTRSRAGHSFVGIWMRPLFGLDGFKKK